MKNGTLIKDIDIIKKILGLTDLAFCKEIGISRTTLNRWTNDEVAVSNEKLEKIYSYAYNKGLRINKIKAQMFIDEAKNNEKILFHGAKSEIVGKLDLKHSKDNNDFGVAFYAGEDLFQSASYVSNINNSLVYICKYKKDDSIKQHEYNVDEDWMLTIAYYRKRLDEYINSDKIKKIIDKVNSFDLIIAPIADNQMYTTLDEFINGLITNIQCEKCLSATDLGKQYCFISNRSLKNVEILSECYLCKEERKEYITQKQKDSEVGIQKVKYARRQYAGKGKYIEELL